MQYFHVKMCIHRTKDMEWVAYQHYSTVLVKSFAHLNGIFFLASLEEIGPPSAWGHRKVIT